MSDQILGMINPAMMLIFAVGGLLLWSYDRANTYVLGYVAGPLLLGCSLVMNHYLLVPDDRLARLASAAFSIAAVIAIVWASCRRIGQRVPVRLWIVGAVFALSMVSFSDPGRDVIPWLFTVNVYCGIIFVMGTQLLSLRHPEHLTDRIVIWVFAIIAAQFFLRPIAVSMIEGAMSSAEYRESAGHAIYILTSAVLTLLLCAAVLGTVLVDQLRSLKEANQTDALSGLASRDAFEAEAGQFIESVVSKGGKVSLVLADIDHFKQVNDLWGHLAGDNAIAGFGALISRTIRDSDWAGRVGGEEFCILVANCDEKQAAGLAERLRRSFARMQHDGLNADIRLTASFGVAGAREGEGYTRTFARADRALYRAKDGGRNRVECSRSEEVSRLNVEHAAERPEQRIANG